MAEYPDQSSVWVREILEPNGSDDEGTILPGYLRRVGPRPMQAFHRSIYLSRRTGQTDCGRMPDVIANAVGKPRAACPLLTVRGFSRKLTARFFFRTLLMAVLRGQVDAQTFFGGSPHTLV